MADLGQDDLRGALVDTGDGVQLFDDALERDDLGLDAAGTSAIVASTINSSSRTNR